MTAAAVLSVAFPADKAAPFEALAAYLVDSGRVVPGLVVEPDGRLRAQWWPLPAAADRILLAAQLPDATQEAAEAFATALAEAVDRLVRQRLPAGLSSAAAASPTSYPPFPSTSGSLPEAWLAALSGPDPYLPEGGDLAAEAAFTLAVHQWVRQGGAAAGELQLCLRVHEPAGEADPGWLVELLLRSVADPSLMAPLGDFWAGQGPFAARPDRVRLRETRSLGAVHSSPTDPFEAVLAQLGLLVRLAPELAPLLDQPAPSVLPLEEVGLLQLLRQRTAVLDEAGFGLLLPGWWRQGRRPGLRARSQSCGTTAPGGEGGGLNLEALVTFRWEAVLGDRPLSSTELETLRQATEAKRELVKLRGEWTQVDPAAIRELLRHAGLEGEATGGELLRGSLGLTRLGLPAHLELVEVQVGGPLGELISGDLHERAAPIPTPAAFAGTLRPYQERGLSWLVFLGRLGLGACLADDMGLGKTAQLIATLLADPLEAPTLVVAPVSLLGNWSRELERFAPSLPVLVHHGPQRRGGKPEAFAKALRAVGPGAVVLTTYGVVSRDLPLLASLRFGRLVFDEAQQLKNPYTAQSRAAAALQGERRIALTGTPVENRLSELWALMQLLNPGLLGSLGQFRDQFAVPIERDHDPVVAARLQRLTGPFLLRRLKSDRNILPDLPGKIEQSEPCRLTPEQATLYQAVVEELLEAADEQEGIGRRGAVLAGLTRLKQVCNHPAHFLADGSALPQRSGKLERSEDLLAAILDADEKVLLFTQYAAWGELLRVHLRGRFGHGFPGGLQNIDFVDDVRPND